MGSQEAFFAALGAVPAAAALLQSLRWPDGVRGPHCGSADIGGNGRYHRNPALPRYRCRAWRRRFLVTNRPSYLKLHQFERTHRERLHGEQAELLLASLLGNGPAPRCLMRPEWGHTMAECRVGRHVRQGAGEESLPLAA
jgi:hypothetical protein